MRHEQTADIKKPQDDRKKLIDIQLQEIYKEASGKEITVKLMDWEEDFTSLAQLRMVVNDRIRVFAQAFMKELELDMYLLPRDLFEFHVYHGTAHIKCMPVTKEDILRMRERQIRQGGICKWMTR